MLALLAMLVPPCALAQTESFFIQEYQVEGVHHLSSLEVEEAVYPFLGPERTKADVEQARAALEKAYRAKGYDSTVVQIPSLALRAGGVVVMQVLEPTVERLRVSGARYFSPNAIKEAAPSLAPGQVLNQADNNRDLVALNQSPDRRVTPSLQPGSAPGSVNIDLQVEDKLPLHASVEVNNRYSANTTPLRLNASVSDTDLWQLGHTFGLSYQVAPERPADAEVFSAYYLVHVANPDWLSLMLQGSRQDSDVSTLGGADVVGRGTTVGPRAIITLPSAKDYSNSLSLGVDYKHFDQNIAVGGGVIAAPITYFPLVAAYASTWTPPGSVTEFNATVTLHLRGLGSGGAAFNRSRFGAGENFIYLRSDLAHTHDLPGGFQLYGKAQGQIADQPLLSAEQFSGGGLTTARGYLEGETVGDDAIFGTIELRSPSICDRLGVKDGEWRVYLFGDAGRESIISPLPGQVATFELASYGFGTRLRIGDHFNFSLDAGFPVIGDPNTKAGNLRVTFRASAAF